LLYFRFLVASPPVQDLLLHPFGAASTVRQARPAIGDEQQSVVSRLVLDVFGLAASVPSVHCSIWPLVDRSTQQVQTNRVKCDVVDSKLRFNCVSTRPKAEQMVRLFLRLLQEARQCFARTFVRCERTIRYCRIRGRGETNMSTKV